MRTPIRSATPGPSPLVGCAASSVTHPSLKPLSGSVIGCDPTPECALATDASLHVVVRGGRHRSRHRDVLVVGQQSAQDSTGFDNPSRPPARRAMQWVFAP